MRLDLLAEMLEINGFGQRGTDIFVHRMDADATRGIMLRNPINGIETDYNMPGYLKTTTQVIVRDTDQVRGDTTSAAIMKLFTMYRVVFSDPNGGAFLMQINQMYPEKLPIVYPRSDGRVTEWSLNFNVTYVLPMEG
jgi:hypothetical protein